jgi:hypothetical protein
VSVQLADLRRSERERAGCAVNGHWHSRNEQQGSTLKRRWTAKLFYDLGLLLLGSLPGILVGSQLAIRVPDTMLRLALSGVLFIVGGRLML